MSCCSRLMVNRSKPDGFPSFDWRRQDRACRPGRPYPSQGWDLLGGVFHTPDKQYCAGRYVTDGENERMVDGKLCGPDGRCSCSHYDACGRRYLTPLLKVPTPEGMLT